MAGLLPNHPRYFLARAKTRKNIDPAGDMAPNLEPIKEAGGGIQNFMSLKHTPAVALKRMTQPTEYPGLASLNELMKRLAR